MDNVLLEKYFKGESCTEEELRSIEEWLSSSAQTEAFFYERWKQAEGKVRLEDSERLWAAINAGVSTAPVRPLLRRRWVAVAAAMAGVLLLAGGLVYRGHRDEFVTTAWKTIENNSKDVKHIRLEDGSQIWLNAHSVLSYDGEYARNGHREIKLSGEAFFDVVQDPLQPFVVHTGNLRTAVLGTSFDIRAWPALRQMQVALVSGKVRVSSDSAGKQVTLTPGTVLNYDLAEDRLVMKEMGVRSDMTDWVKGKIVLDNTSLLELTRQLEQIYKVSIVVPAGQPDSIRLSGQFRRDSIGSVLNNVLFPLDLTYTYKNGRYMIHALKIK